MAESSTSVQQREKKQYSADAYTVAWICALPVPELQASRHMFDETHKDPKLLVQTQNRYVYGEINGHAVVMACCPLETIGLSPAAALMSEMIALFKSLRFAVLVGVAGGVWTEKQDIRLGDVVVSKPSRDPPHGGVVQYDFAKKVSDQPPRHMGWINRPIPLLLSTLGHIQSTPSAESSFEEYLATFNSYRGQDLATSPFQRPNTDDVLYTTDHVSGKSVIAERPPRAHTRSVVHYGLIASGNLVIKDAVERDKIIAQLAKDVLAFEMEAAGVMNQDLSCLVIRGICDYCDHHKKKEWQPYAAAAAAAWTKEFFRNVTPLDAGKLLVVRAASPAVSEQDTWLTTFGTQLTNSKKSIDKSKRKAQLLMNRISQYDAATTLLRWSKRRLRGTTEWIFQQSTFDAWLRQAEPGVLLLSGKIGSGKTIAMASIVDHLRIVQPNTAIVHYFAQDNGSSLTDVFRSFTKQIIQTLRSCKKPCPPSTVDPLERAFGDDNRVPDTPALIHSILVPLIKDVQEVIFCLDGIDSFDIESQRETLEGIALLDSKLIVSSRDQSPVRGRFSQGISTISLDAENSKQDIALYIDDRFRRLSHAGEVLHEALFRERLKAELLEKAAGMFLWVHLQLEFISECNSQEEIMGSTNDLPTKLDKIFRRCLLVKHEGKLLCNPKILKWVAAALQPLKIQQIREMLELDGSAAKNIERGGVNLIVLQHDGTIVPVHDTVRHFLFNPSFQNDIQPNGEFADSRFQELTSTRKAAILDIADLSLRVIHSSCSSTMVAKHSIKVPSPMHFTSSLLSMARPRNTSASMVTINIPKLKATSPFLDYAIKTWTEHTREISSTHRSWNLFKDTALQYNFVPAVHPWLSSDDRDHATDNTHRRGLLGYAVAHNHEPLLQVVLQHGRLPREVYNRPLPRNDLLPPLLVAAVAGYESIVSALLPVCNINVGVPKRKNTALYYALTHGHSAVATLLLERNIDYMLWPKDERSALHLAAEAGFTEVVHLLLEKRVKDSGVLPFSDSAEIYKCTAVRCAAYHGHIQIVKLLITSNSSYDFNGALLVAALQSQVGIINFLLDQESVLTWTEGRKQDLKVMMLPNLSKVRAALTNMIITKEGDIASLLEDAVEYGDVPSAQLLIDKGASAEAIDKALVEAAYGHSLEIAQLLIDKGASAEAIDKALVEAAAGEGSLEIARLLIDKGASAEAIDEALVEAAYWDRLEIALLLIDKGASAEAIDKTLDMAVQRNKTAMVKFLEDRRSSARRTIGQRSKAR